MMPYENACSSPVRPKLSPVRSWTLGGQLIETQLIYTLDTQAVLCNLRWTGYRIGFTL